MTDEEVIKQLENLKEHCASMIKDEDIWTKDVDALNRAIELFRDKKDGLWKRRGHWIEKDMYYNVKGKPVKELICGLCGFRKVVTEAPNYCQNCGAEIVRWPQNKYAQNPWKEEGE